MKRNAIEGLGIVFCFVLVHSFGFQVTDLAVVKLF